MQRPRTGRLLAGAFIIALLGAGLLGWRYHAEIVPRPYNPFTELDVADETSFATRFKLMRAGADAAYCRRALATSDLEISTLPDMPTVDGCGLENGVRVSGGAVALSGAFTATCPLALSYAMFERHVARPAARMYFGAELRSITHVGSHVYRNVAGTDRRSDHATANALDVTAFTLVSGARVDILRDWPDDDREARFLRQLRDGACRYFRGVLGPDYNSAHADHFHFAAAGFSVCR